MRDAWAAQAKADWHASLQYRALEMQSSARLLIVGSGADQQGNSGAEGLMLMLISKKQKVRKVSSFYSSGNAIYVSAIVRP